MALLIFEIDDQVPVDFVPQRLVIAGWSGSNHGEIERHIAELVEVGVKRPSMVPCFYEASPSLLTTDSCIAAVGEHSTGEVEAVVLHDVRMGLLVGIGSDHTDRKVERYDVAVSKQMCAKPIGAELWRYDEVKSHWGELIARSWRFDADGNRVLYQEGSLVRLLNPAQLIERRFGEIGMPVGTILFCGTQPVLGELSASEAFEIELYDPVLQRSLWHRYEVAVLAHVE